MRVTMLGVGLVFLLISCNGQDQAGKLIDPEALQTRVISRWNSLKSGDLNAVYGYFSPEYRRLNTYDSFAAGIGVSVKWLSYVVEDVDVKDNRAKVLLTIVYQLKLPPGAGMDFGSQIGDVSAQNTEFWVLRSGKWWFVNQKQGL